MARSRFRLGFSCAGYGLARASPFRFVVFAMLEKDGARAQSGGRAMRTVFYLLVGIIAFGTYYAVYGLGVATARLIRCCFLAGECCMPNRPPRTRRACRGSTSQRRCQCRSAGRAPPLKPGGGQA